MKKITLLFIMMLSASIYAFSCETPLNPRAFLTRAGLVSLVWERPVVAVSFQVEISIPPDAAACGGGTGGTPVILLDEIYPNTIGLFPVNFEPEELPEATVMQFRVRTICLDGFSEYSPYVPITKPLAGTEVGGDPETECSTPSNPYVGHNRANNVCLHWDDVGDALYYDLCVDGSLYKSLANTRADFQYCNCYCFDEGDLDIGDHYFQVRAVCQGGYSPPTPVINFFVSHREVNNAIVETAGDIKNIFPNPSDGKITVEFNSNSTGKIRLNVYDVTGRVVFNQTDIAKEGINTFDLHLDLPQGAYLLEGNDGVSSSRMKFMIVK